MTTCIACEGFPSNKNNPCGLCGATRQTDMADRITDILVEDHVNLMAQNKIFRDLLTEIKPFLDEWNFPVSLSERVDEALK